ncbi:MAG: hypothetical protein JRC68_03420 [Deltaproteobacteria bacterium]|nr:hypothetical protein [Deltaproteobacteria bacterium]
MEFEDNKQKTGIITSRECPLCGHHEIGYTTMDGEFHPMRPGSLVQVLEEPETPATHQEDMAVHQEMGKEIKADLTGYKAWVPAPVRNDRDLRMKYGVLLREELLAGKITGEIYESLYLSKIVYLIEQRPGTPLPVLLDRFFAAPQLASGLPRQIAANLWQELDEIKQPALLACEWLEKQDEDSLARMIHPRSKDELTDQPVSDAEFKKELEELTMEGFLELL